SSCRKRCCAERPSSRFVRAVFRRASITDGQCSSATPSTRWWRPSAGSTKSIAPSAAPKAGAASAQRRLSTTTSASTCDSMPTERRLLMISPHFPPDSSAGTHRVRLLAPPLAAFGWTPTVLTVAQQDYEGRIDPELASLVPSSLDVLRSRALPAALTRRIGLGDLGLRALPGLHRAAWRLHRERPFDAVFITIYPTYPALLGPLMKRRFQVPFVLDYQDPWVGAWGQTVGAGPAGAVDLESRSTRALAERLEPRVLHAADAVTAVSARTYEDALARSGAARREVAEIPIGWDPVDVEAVANRRSHPNLIPRDGRVNICYTGTLLPLGIGTLRAVLAGTRALLERDPHLADRVRFYFFGTSNQTTDATPRVPRMRGSWAWSIWCTNSPRGSITSMPSMRCGRRTHCSCLAARSATTRRARCFRRCSRTAR